ncbi:LPS export ABC transporter periplasmic protein LptC [Roseospira goensis]|uniref:Lipopolysaccharide export system protein LptC n=1 Tax=Roseospira goensis TaxID=391922 RepID=A0A7W6WKK3_9PROT|nr:LPS export ABC transporter periplasmic protein LptC [Roseospira goensis]MBB4286411.1 lipopolysaccharide export system protein LptC [Roseospira goensis]
MKLDRTDRTARTLTEASTAVPRAEGGDIRGRGGRPAGSLHGARRYSRFVRLMKLLLPSVAVVLLGLVLAWPQIRSQADRFAVGFASLDPRDANPRSLVNPRFHGVDAQDQPYTLVAERAVEQAGNPDQVDLEQPQGDILVSGGRWVAVRGNSGVYSKIERTLTLDGDVMLYRDDGFEFHTEVAHVDLASNSAHGDARVRGRGPGRIIESRGFEFVDGGRVVRFTGQARLLLEDGGGGIAP